MFSAEYGWARLHRMSIEKSRKEIVLDGQRHWRTNEPSEAEGINIPGRCIYAQNDAYIEFCNPGWDLQWRVGFGVVYGVLPALFLIWACYGFTIHPLLFGNIVVFFPWSTMGYESEMWPILLVGWLIAFPIAIASIFMLHLWFNVMGTRASFFTYARGRVRFNRLTRKVYVLRPNYCGGNRVFEWDRLVALLKRVPDDHKNPDAITGSLVLYQAPDDPNDEKAVGEDAIFVGPSLHFKETQTAPLWEYIRRYMEDGPTVDRIPPNAPEDYKQVPRYLPQEYTTYCGKPSRAQYRLEQRPGIMETTFHMMTQITCSWPRFPKEWQSDCGLGEPEDRPVQTGAVMTAMVYRAEGKLSAEDELEFLTHWGTKEALAEAQAKTQAGRTTYEVN